MSRRTSNRLGCEALEDREVPAVLFAVTTDQQLVTFDSSNPGVLLGSVALSGLARGGEQITDIDVRPGSGGLYGRSGDGRVYLINTVTGGATLLGGGVTAAGEAGFDFNPRSDRIRVVNVSGQDVRLDPATGAVVSTGARPVYRAGDPFAGLAPQISALAHTNSVPLASSTQLYGIDSALNTLVRAAGGSQFVTVGSLGVDVARAAGFDIDPNGGVGYAVFRPQAAGAASVFSVVDLNSGAATVLGPVGNNLRVFDVAASRTLTSAGQLPPAANPAGFGFTTTTLAATVNSVVLPPVTPNPNPTVTLPGVGQFTVPTSGLAPGLVQSINGSLIAPLGPGLVGQAPLAFGLPSVATFGRSFLVAPQGTFTAPTFGTFTTPTFGTFNPTLGTFNSFQPFFRR